MSEQQRRFLPADDRDHVRVLGLLRRMPTFLKTCRGGAGSRSDSAVKQDGYQHGRWECCQMPISSACLESHSSDVHGLSHGAHCAASAANELMALAPIARLQARSAAPMVQGLD